jgi:hypothetical protein
MQTSRTSSARSRSSWLPVLASIVLKYAPVDSMAPATVKPSLRIALSRRRPNSGSRVTERCALRTSASTLVPSSASLGIVALEDGFERGAEQAQLGFDVGRGVARDRGGQRDAADPDRVPTPDAGRSRRAGADFGPRGPQRRRHAEFTGRWERWRQRVVTAREVVVEETRERGQRLGFVRAIDRGRVPIAESNIAADDGEDALGVGDPAAAHVQERDRGPEAAGHLFERARRPGMDAHRQRAGEGVFARHVVSANGARHHFRSWRRRTRGA